MVVAGTPGKKDKKTEDEENPDTGENRRWERRAGLQ